MRRPFIDALTSVGRGVPWLLLLIGALFIASRSERPLPPPDVTYVRTVQPLLKKYCYSCHGHGRPKGDLALDIYRDEATVRKDAKTWKIVLHHLRTGEMPPKNKPQPTIAEREQICAWLQATIF